MHEPYQPLRGVTILAWEQAVSLPMATRLLGDLGATVIRLDSHVRTRPRPRYLSNDLARNKLSLAIDLREPRGQQLVRALVQKVDVFCENYTPRVKRQFDLTYERLRVARPDLIMLSLSGYGQTGPWSERPTFGPGIEAAAGYALSIGYPDSPPTRPGTVVYADNVSGFYAAFAVLAALHHRRITGEGQYIDLSMYEANAFHLRLSVALSSLTGEPQPRRGNSDAYAAFQDVMRSAEAERWLAVTVCPGQLQSLMTVLRDAGVLRDGGNDDVYKALRQWVSTKSAEDAARELQQAGVAAVAVHNARDLFLSAHLRYRQAFTLIQHGRPVNGYSAHPHAAQPWRFVGHRRPYLREAPLIGEHSREVLVKWLNMPESEIDALIADGVVGDAGHEPYCDTVHASEEWAMRRISWRLAAGFEHDPERVIGLGDWQLSEATS